MAEAAALASIAKSALKLFTSLAKDEFLLLWNSQKELERLEATIETLTYIHQDTQERASNEAAVQHCLSRMRNVMYNAEDLFDGLAAQVLRKRSTGGNVFTKEVRMFFSESNQLGFIFKTADKVKAIRRSLDDVKKDMEFYGLIRQPLPIVQPFVRPKTHSFLPEEDVIGRDEDRDRIINMLLPPSEGATSKNNRLSAIAIIGFGGLGKTTLAQYVYNDERVKQSFDVHLWACINYLSDLEQVLIEIIASKEKRHSDLGLEKLQETLRGIISGRKFLLVLDDVWDENSGNWLKLESILRCGKFGSKFLATTRSRKVVECLDALKPNHCVDLAVLSKESAWSLFVKRAFYNEDELCEHPELEPLGNKIVDRCGNVPLAINIVGSLLRHKEKDGKTWSNFLENDLKRTIANSDDIKSVLMVSYNNLHPKLKLCFAYCSLFPKDHMFDKEELVRLWIAQGFINPCGDNERSLEKEGEGYFFHLAERCFFQEVKQKDWHIGNIGYHIGNDRYGHIAKMHDLLHDIAIDVAKTESAIFYKVPDNKMGSLRHMSVKCVPDNSFDYCSLVFDPNTVRTLVSDFGEFSDPFNMSLGRFRMLRALNLAWWEIDSISESLGELIHLRYLNLSQNRKLRNLPNSICKLHHLMILVLVNCEILEDLPPKIEKLVSLRQLWIHGCERMRSPPSGLTALTSLVKLDRIIVDPLMGGLRYLQDIDNLHGNLKIELPGRDGWKDAKEDALKANMSRKAKLGGMVIKWKDRWNLPIDEAKAVLDALEPHKNLDYLEIVNYRGEMLSSWVGTLKNLTGICLAYCEHVEYLEDEIRGDLYFPFLKSIALNTLSNLKGWWRQEVVAETKRPCLRKVSKVSISHCPKLKGPMPLFEGVEELTLTGVHVELVTELLMSMCCRNNSMKTLDLFSIEGLMALPVGWIRHLIHLQKLSIYSNELMWVSCQGLAQLTVLKELYLHHGKIVDFGDDDEMKVITEATGMPWKALKALETLLVQTLDERLIVGLKYLTSLKSLNIRNWKEEQMAGGEEMEASFLESSFKALQNLEDLTIGFGNRRTARLPLTTIQYLPRLESLGIEECKELYLGLKTLLSMKLVSLQFEKVEKVIDVEEKAMEQQSQLHSLSISDIDGAAEWVDNIPWISLSSSLQTLSFYSIRGMKQLPDGIQHLISLEYLDSMSCTVELKRRCEEERGEDWPLIRHIPSIEIKSDEDVQRELVEEEEGGEGSLNKEGCGCGLSLPKFKHRL